tara:strand:- start:497 stop:1240 length:744 start_codon:yes stop_codon:yes gene_type:complete
MMMREKLLELCFDKDLKMMFLKQLRFMHFYDGKWMPKKGDNNASTSAIRNFPEQIGLFKILFRKTLSPSQGARLGPIGFGTINNTLTETGIKLEQIGAVREITGTSTLGPGSDYKITKEGEELHTKLEKQYEEARAMPFVKDVKYTITARNGTSVGRIYLQNKNLRDAGFPDGTAIEVVFNDGNITITPCADGPNVANHVSGQIQTASNARREVIDIRNNEINRVLGNPGDDVKYTIYPFKIIIEKS